MKITPKHLTELKNIRTVFSTSGSFDTYCGVADILRHSFVCFCLMFLTACSEQRERSTVETVPNLLSEQETALPDIQKSSVERGKEMFAESREAFLSQAVSEYLAYPVSVDVNMLGTHQTWALLCGKPLALNGSPIDYSNTSIASLAAEGVVDDYFCALIQSSATPNKWTLHELVVGSSDSPLFEWVERYELPESIFDSKQ